jgi:hypothetical protein
MSRSVFALGFQQETQSGQLCTEPMSSQNRPESQGEKWVFESQFIRPRHLRSTGWTSCPPTKIRGEKDCGHIREGTMSSRVELDASPSFSMANRECVGQKKKKMVCWVLPMFSVVNFGGNSGACIPQLPNCKTKAICGNSKCPAVFPHPSSGKDGSGLDQSILRPSSKRRRQKESGSGRCKSLQRREKEGAFPRAGGQNG